VLSRIEVLGFCDEERSPRWIAELGARNMNLLVKGSESHCRHQLRVTPAAHFATIATSANTAARYGVCVSGVYLEDWSRGIAASPAYVFELTEHVLRLGISRIFLADTLGCLPPGEVERHVATMVARYPAARFEFHGHDDYGLATANCLAAVAAGVSGVHATVNGLGERAGNAHLAEVVVALHDHAAVSTNAEERALVQLAELVERLSDRPLARNTPIVGRDVFTQTAGVHADGDRKAQLYASRLAPERFGRTRRYALGKLSGLASVDLNLEALGLALSPAQRRHLLTQVVALADRKCAVYSTDLLALLAEPE
jgi:D-citramalate synthase